MDAGLWDLHGGNALGLQEQAMHGMTIIKRAALERRRETVQLPRHPGASRDPDGDY